MNEPKAKSRPVISVAVRPKSDGDREDFQRALGDLVHNDPTATVAQVSEHGNTIIRGMSELHLEEICGRISREYQIEIDVGVHEVIYLETIRRSAEAEGKYIRQIGGSGNYGHCKLRVEPNEPGSGYEFLNAIKGGSVPDKYIKYIDQGVQDAAELGILAGCPLADVKVTLCDGSYHEKDSNELAFKFAGSIAFKEAAGKVSPVLLEPVMAVEVTVPEEHTGTVIADISSRRGRIEGLEQAGGWKLIKATVPLVEMLQSSAQGRADYPMYFAGYEAVPRGGWPGDDIAAVPVKKPQSPRAGSGFAAAKLNPEFE
jgi:elongation factor G